MSGAGKAVFLSYSVDDEPAARRLCTALRAAGIEVWFDRTHLHGGDAWDALIRRHIRECALFVPLISANTEARSEGYFRLEWRLAVERSLQMSDDQAFLLPVVLDATAQTAARVPDRFRERHWTSLPDGAATPDFIAHVSALLDLAPAAPVRSAHVPTAEPPIRAPRRTMFAGVAAVLLLAGAASTWWWVHRGAPVTAPDAGAADRKSIAVLPFENLTGHPEDAYLADGLQEEILNALARIRELKVISRTSVAEYRGAHQNVREIGRRLGVGSALEGSIRRDGRQLRLTLQLIDARDDRHLLATNYDRDLDHILGLQSAVAHEVAEALTATLSRFERGELDRVGTNNGDAYRAYLQATALFRRSTADDQDGLIEPSRLLEEAVRLDPDFSDAYALLAQAYTWRYFRSLRPDDGARAKAAFERALAIDPALPDAKLARGLYSMYVVRDIDRALADLEAVAQLRPNSVPAQSALGSALRRKGRMDEALPHLRRAWDLDPLNETYSGGVFTTLLGLRRYPEALDETRLFVTRFPDKLDGFLAQAELGVLLQSSPEPLRALARDHPALVDSRTRPFIDAEIATAERQYSDAANLWVRFAAEDPSRKALQIGCLLVAAGDLEGATLHFREAESLLEQHRSEFDQDDYFKRRALIKSGLGEHAAALATIDEARQALPESRDPVNGPPVSFVRSVVLARAGRTTEAYAEVDRLLRVPFGSPAGYFDGTPPEVVLVVNDRHFDEILRRPPRL